MSQTPKKGDNQLGSASSSPKESPGTPSRRRIWPSKRLKLTETDTFQTLESLALGTHLDTSVKFRVTFVTRKTEWKVFYFRGKDDSAERIIKAFPSQSRLIENLELNSVYTLRSFKMDPPFFGDENEIVLTKFSTLTKIQDQGEFPIVLDKKGLNELSSVPKGSAVDVIGIVMDIPMSDKDDRKEVIISDESKEEVLLVFWKDDINYDCKNGDVLFLRGAKNGLPIDGQQTLNINHLTLVWKNPNTEEEKKFRSNMEKLFKEEGLEI